MPHRDQVVAEARTWVGTPYHHQGRLKGVGCDCIGLLIGVAKNLGMADVKIDGYGLEPDGVTFLQQAGTHMTKIPLADMQPGDVVAFRIGKFPRHVAILADHPNGGLSIIHTLATGRTVVETILDETWRARIVAAYVLPGVV